MSPWEDAGPTLEQRTEPRRLTATNVLVGLSVAGFIATGLAARHAPGRLAALEFHAVEALEGLRLWQVLTYPFVQAVDFWFLFGFLISAYGLWSMGNALESRIGPRRLLVYWISFTAYGALAHAAIQHFAPGARDLRAASLIGPAFGLSLAAALHLPGRPLLLFFLVPVRAPLGAAVLGVAAAAFGALCHPPCLGPLAGAALAAAAVVRLEPALDAALDRATERAGRLRFVREVEIRREADLLLEKISREGMASLGAGERRTLREAGRIARRDREGGRA
jgi:membrane associated rhomboid family serine protease